MPGTEDTSAEARRLQRSTRASMTEEMRLRAVLELCDDVRAVALSGVRSRHPGASPSDAAWLLMEQWYGLDLAAAAQRRSQDDVP